MDEMIAWCNSLGGINGREVVGNRYDAALDNASQVIVESCAQDFMMVGQGFAGDEDMEADRVACQLPMVPGFTLSSNANNGPMSYAPLPFPVDQLSVARAELTLETYPEAVLYDFIGHDSPFTQIGEKRTAAVFESVGRRAGRLRRGAQVRGWRQLPGARPALPGVRCHGPLRPGHADARRRSRSSTPCGSRATSRRSSPTRRGTPSRC